MCHGAILEGDKKLAGSGIPLSSCTPPGLTFLPDISHAANADDRQSAQFLHPFSQTDICSPSGHGGCHCHGIHLPGFPDDLRLPERVIGVQHIMRNTFLHQIR